MTQQNNIRNWIADTFMDTLERNYNEIAAAVADYGYAYVQMGDGLRTSTTVKHMFIVPRDGAVEQFTKIAKNMGVVMTPKQMQVDGVMRDGFLIDPIKPDCNYILASMARQAVKSERARAAMMQHAADMQSRR